MRLSNRFFSRWNVALVYFLFLSLLVRLPFFFEAVINWDESTFILVGQSLLDGHLPYTELWDLKPPFVAVAFALFISLLGKSIASVRLAGALCVTLTAWFTYIVGRTIWTPRIGLIGGTLFVLLISLFPDGQPTMTEHVALVPLMGAAVVAVTATRLTLRRLFWIGLWLTVATMIRLNLAYVTLIVGIFVTVMPLSKRRPALQMLRSVFIRGCAYTAGSLLIIFITILPYLATNQLSTWWQSVVVAPLNYSSSQVSLLAALYAHYQAVMATLTFGGGNPEAALNWFSLVIVSRLVWFGAMVGLTIVVFRWRSTAALQRRSSLFLLCFFAGTVFSLARGGATFFHYLLQLFPFVTLLAAVSYDALLKKTHRGQTAAALLLVIAITLRPMLPEYQEIHSRIARGQGLEQGSAYEIADYLKQANPESDPVYMMTEHIVYWFTDEKPLSAPTTHPSNIGRDYMLGTIVGPGTTSKMEMAKIFAQKPAFVVKPKEVSYLETQPAASAYLDRVLQSDYDLVKVIEEKGIYQRR